MEIITKEELGMAFAFIGENGKDSVLRAKNQGVRVFFYYPTTALKDGAILKEQMRADGIFTEDIFENLKRQMKGSNHGICFLFPPRMRYNFPGDHDNLSFFCPRCGHPYTKGACACAGYTGH